MYSYAASSTSLSDTLLLSLKLDLSSSHGLGAPCLCKALPKGGQSQAPPVCPALTFPKIDHSSFYLFNLLPDVRDKDVAVLTSSFAIGPKWTPAGLAKGCSARPGRAGKVACVPRAPCLPRTRGKLAVWSCFLKNLQVSLCKEGKAPGRVPAPFQQCGRILSRSHPPAAGCWQWQEFPRAAPAST